MPVQHKNNQNHCSIVYTPLVSFLLLCYPWILICFCLLLLVLKDKINIVFSECIKKKNCAFSSLLFQFNNIYDPAIKTRSKLGSNGKDIKVESVIYSVKASLAQVIYYGYHVLNLIFYVICVCVGDM